MDELLEAIKVASNVLSSPGLPFAVCGGLAVYARGGMPSNHDVDFLVRREQAEAALAALSGAGLRTERPPEGWLVKAYYEGTLIDLIYEPVGRPVTEETLSDVDLLPVGPVRLPVLSATELLIHAVGTLTTQHCDLAGPLRLARTLREQIDLARVRDETKDNPFARAFLTLGADLDVFSGSRS